MTNVTLNNGRTVAIKVHRVAAIFPEHFLSLTVAKNNIFY